jgi:exonuclease SbcD
MTRFIHTSDWHIGASKFVGDGYLDRQLSVIDTIVAVAQERGIDTIVVAGDVFDVEQPEPHEREALLDRILAYDRKGIRILCIRGNHDQGSMTGRTAIRYLSHMSDHGVFKNCVFAERTQYVRVRDTVFLLLCHNPRFFQEECARAIHNFKRSSLNVPHTHFVVVAHEAIKGSVTDTNYRMTDGSEIPLDVGESVPDSQDVAYWAFGDIHIRQRLGPRAFYCGAPLQVKFGDAWPKGVLVVDTENPGNPEFVTIPSRRLVKVRVVEGEVPVFPEDAHIKLVAAPTVYTEMRDQGTLPDNIARLEAVKDTVAIDYAQTLDLPSKVMAGLEQLLSDPADLDLGKREANALFSATGLA